MKLKRIVLCVSIFENRGEKEGRKKVKKQDKTKRKDFRLLVYVLQIRNDFQITLFRIEIDDGREES